MTPESLDGVGPARSEAHGEAKEALRASMRHMRAAIPTEERARLSGVIEEVLLELPEVIDAGTVLLYSSFGTEVSTEGMVARMLASGKRVLLPYVVDDRTMEAADVLAGEPLVTSSYGPGEPSARIAIQPVAVDLVVIPGLAFDRRGHRLGYGGGHYDRYLARMGHAGIRVGVAFSLQVVDRIPEERGDVSVDLIVTEEGALDLRP